MIQATDVLAAGLFASQELSVKPPEGEAQQPVLWSDLPEETREVYRADAAFLCTYLGSTPVGKIDSAKATQTLLKVTRGEKLYVNPTAAIRIFQHLHAVTRG